MLFLTLALCSVAAWYWFLPRDLRDFSQSLAASALFVSNLIFLRESGYFDLDSELKPLLHTWSLSIEEQYYILFPLMLGLLFRWFRRQMFPIILAILLISFGWATWSSVATPQRAYFLLTTRIWELLAGVAAMFIISRRAPGAAAHRFGDMLAGLGLMLIAISVIAFDQTTLFPAPFGLLPVLGTVLVVLYARADTRLGRILGLRPLVLIGLISYSAYLFHQPLLAFLRYLTPAEPAIAVRLLVVCAIFPLAWLSWTYVETPFRSASVFSRRSIFRGAVLGICCFALLGVIGSQRRGYLRFDLSPAETATLHSLERSGLADCKDIAKCLAPRQRRSGLPKLLSRSVRLS